MSNDAFFDEDNSANAQKQDENKSQTGSREEDALALKQKLMMQRQQQLAKMRSTGSTQLSKQENGRACVPQAEYAEMHGWASRSKASKEIPGQCTGKQ